MTARVLVADGNPSNIKLLEEKLTAEYFEVITASSGEDALSRITAELPDIVLLDTMIPGMDGFEVCRRIKSNIKTAHIPVAMMTARNRSIDGVTGLNAGADDFLTKPVDELALFARIRSLVRMKMMTDELRMREETGQSMGLTDACETIAEPDPTGCILIVEDRPESVAWFRAALEPKNDVADVSTFDESLVRARCGDFDLIVVSLDIRGFDGLRLCSHLRSLGEARNTPILVLVSENEPRKLAQAMDIGVNDYLMRPVDRNELLARVRTQLRKKRYADRLRHNMQRSLEMAITDPRRRNTPSASASGVQDTYNGPLHRVDQLARRTSPEGCMRNVTPLVKTALGLVAMVFAAGFGIGSLVYMPGYAAVYLDDATKTYIALPCLEEWRNRPSKTFDIVRLSKAGEAQRLHYKLDDNCREAGGYIDDDRSLSGLLLVKLGILPPARHWWDAPYRTEQGEVVWPAGP